MVLDETTEEGRLFHIGIVLGKKEFKLGKKEFKLNLGRRFARSGGCPLAPGSLLATDRSKAVVLV